MNKQPGMVVHLALGGGSWQEGLLVWYQLGIHSKFQNHIKYREKEGEAVKKSINLLYLGKIWLSMYKKACKTQIDIPWKHLHPWLIVAKLSKVQDISFLNLIEKKCQTIPLKLTFKGKHIRLITELSAETL